MVWYNNSTEIKKALNGQHDQKVEFPILILLENTKSALEKKYLVYRIKTLRESGNKRTPLVTKLASQSLDLRLLYL